MEVHTDRTEKGIWLPFRVCARLTRGRLPRLGLATLGILWPRSPGPEVPRRVGGGVGGGSAHSRKQHQGREQGLRRADLVSAPKHLWQCQGPGGPAHPQGQFEWSPQNGRWGCHRGHLAFTVPEAPRRCEVLGSGSGQAEGPWSGVAICLEPPSLGLMLPSSSWAPGLPLVSSSTLWMWGPSLGSSHQQRAREGAPWTLHLALGALAPFLENSLRTRLLVGRGPTTSCAEKKHADHSGDSGRPVVRFSLHSPSTLS